MALTFVVVAGCTTRRGSLEWTGVGVGGALLGGLMTRSDWGDEGPPGFAIGIEGGLLFGGAAIAIASGLNAIFQYAGPVFRREPRARRPPERELANRRRDEVRERAWTITKATASAARTGDCDAVVRADAEVRALDLEFHATVFSADVAIRRCLASHSPTEQ